MEYVDIDKYKIVKKIGIGGSSKIYLALNVSEERKCILKIIRRKSSFTDHMIETEVNILTKLNGQHNYTPKIYNTWERNDAFIIEMEFLNGYDLVDYIGDYWFNLDNNEHLLEMCDKLLHGLYYLHTNDIAHRDIKLENIMIIPLSNNKFDIKYIDFGLSCFEQTSIYVNTHKKIDVGSLSYVAPELVFRESQQYKNYIDASSLLQIGQKSDIWSLGVVIYTLVNKKFPYDDITKFPLTIENSLKPGMYKINEILNLMLDPNPETRSDITTIIKLTQ